jgi:hypothetical protein
MFMWVIFIYKPRDYSLMAKYMTFNHLDMGSNPIGLNSYRLMVDLSSSIRYVSIRIRLAVY